MYARVLRKCSLAKILMNLWLVVIMLLVIWCQNASAMHLVKNPRSSASSMSSGNAAPRDLSWDPAMTMYSSSVRHVYPNHYQLRRSPRTRYASRGQDLTTRLNEAQQSRQQLISPYTVFIRTNADPAQLSYNVPNIHSQIINLNSNSQDSRSFYVDRSFRQESAPIEELTPVSSQVGQRVGPSEQRILDSSPSLGYDNDRGKLLARRPPRKHLPRERLPNRARSFQGSSAMSQSLQPSPQYSPDSLTLDPFRLPPVRQEEEHDPQEGVRRQRRHRHFEPPRLGQLDHTRDQQKHVPLNSSWLGKSSPFSTITTTFSNTNVDNSKNNSNDSRSSKAPTPSQLGGGNPHENKLISSSRDGNSRRSYRRQRISRSHHPRRRPKRYCSARDPVQLAYLAPLVLEGKVRSMSPNRRGNFSVSFQVTQIFKNRQKHNIGKLDLVRLQFTFLNTSGECDIYQEKFRERGLIRRDLQNGRNYTLFLKYVGEKFVILGQPILSNERIYNYVKNASQEKFGKAASIKLLKSNKQNKVREKEELRIECRVRGNPPPKITWFKDDKSIKQSRQLYQFLNLKRRSELIVKSFSNATAGLYECRAKNMFSKRIEKKTIRIEAYGRRESHNDTGEDCDSSMEAYCLNGGTCRFFSDIRQYYCKCAEGFEGDRCQEKRPTNVALNQTVTGYMADSPTDTMSDESDENLSLSDEKDSN